MREPHASLAAFLGDLNEQCEMYRASARDPLVHCVLSYLQVTIGSCGVVVGINDSERAYTPKPEKR